MCFNMYSLEDYTTTWMETSVAFKFMIKGAKKLFKFKPVHSAKLAHSSTPLTNNKSKTLATTHRKGPQEELGVNL